MQQNSRLLWHAYLTVTFVGP